MTHPQVSILIPCYNGADFVREAVDSALNQTWNSVEVVVVDDGSLDGSVEVLKSFGDQIILDSGPNRGACAARNRAFELSSGDLIQFLDADDKLAQNKIERQYAEMQAKNADLVLCKFGLFGDDRGARPEKRLHPDPEGDPFLYFAAYPIGTPAALYRREVVKRAGGFLTGLSRGQEANFHLRVGALSPVVTMLDELLVWVRMHDGPKITNRPTKSDEVTWSLCNVARHVTSIEGWTDERREWISREILQAARVCYAEGKLEIAREGLELAFEINAHVGRDDHLLRKIFTAIIGPVRSESVVNRLRVFKK